jgi:hypothetical protein
MPEPSEAVMRLPGDLHPTYSHAADGVLECGVPRIPPTVELAGRRAGTGTRTVACHMSPELGHI